MEFFNKAKAVRLRSHHGTFLAADEDEETVRQSRSGSSQKVRWTVEFVQGNCQVLRLKSCHGRYLTASDEPFLLGMTGKKALQTIPATIPDPSIEWEPIRDGFQVKLRTRGGKFLRANGGTPPWRNSVTHDIPHRTLTQDWVFWNVDIVEIPEFESFNDFQSPSFSSVSDRSLGSYAGSPMSIRSKMSNNPRGSSGQTGMELFKNAKAVRLQSCHDKYLHAEEDEDSVVQDRNGSSRTAKWTVEFIEGTNFIRLKSCYGKYLTASNLPFLLGMTGRKVLQTLPTRLDSSLEWEPVREGVQVKLKTPYGNFLRANGGFPPWRNSVTHDIPQITATQDWILWDLDVVEIQLQSPRPQSLARPESEASEPTSPSSTSDKFPNFSRPESSGSVFSSPIKFDGRIINYKVADDNGGVEDSIEMPSFNFKGTSVEELTQKLEEETGLQDIVVCSRNPLNGKLYPLRLQLPPNNTTMNVYVVQSTSKCKL